MAAPRLRSGPVASPFLKWAGGKSQLLPQFESLYPAAEDVERYLEPFVGSGAVFFDVRKVLLPKRSILSDNNADLVNVWKTLKQRVEDVIAALDRHRRLHSERHYYAVRAQKIDDLDEVERAARLIYMNKTCFNGLYRVNSKGQFNVPLGRYVNPPILDAENLRAVCEVLGRASIKVAHFRQTLKDARPGDFVYFDPPYDPLSQTAYFTAYTEGAFGRKDQAELADVYAQLARRGCRVMLSNSDTEFVRSLYRDFDVRTVTARRTINSRADRRGPIGEVVVINYEPPARIVTRKPTRRRASARAD
ncbi:MAG: DNA adenine methylase [Micrococcales bacterium]|nr:DNA adenine methylase [Micrococcales bacterium]